MESKAKCLLHRKQGCRGRHRFRRQWRNLTQLFSAFHFMICVVKLKKNLFNDLTNSLNAKKKEFPHKPWNRKNSSFLHPHLSVACFIASFVNIFLLLCFSSFSRFFFIWFTCFVLKHTFKTRSIIHLLKVTHSSLLNDFLFLFLFPQEFHHWFASLFSVLLSSYAPGCSLSFPRCAVCATLHIIVSCSPDCCFVFRFLTIYFFFLRFRMKLPAISQRYTYTVEAFFQESLLPSGFFFSSRKNFSLESQFILLRGLFLWQFIFISPL